MKINFKKISFILFFIIVLFIKSSLNWKVSWIHSKLFTGSCKNIFCDIAHLINYSISILKIWYSLCLSSSFTYFLLAFTYWKIEWHMFSLILLFTINNISIPVPILITSSKRSNFTLAFFKAAFLANPGPESN